MNDDTLRPMLALLDYLPEPARHTMVAMYRAALREQIALIGGLLDRIATAGAAAAREDGEQLLASVHKIAGSAAMMQDAPLSQAARGIETALRAGCFGPARTLWPQLQGCSRMTLQVLDQAFPATA